MPSASHHLGARLGLLGLCLTLLAGAASGCSTTQEKAETQQARAEHILKARAERQQAKKHHHGKSGKQGGEGS